MMIVVVVVMMVVVMTMVGVGDDFLFIKNIATDFKVITSSYKYTAYHYNSCSYKNTASDSNVAILLLVIIKTLLVIIKTLLVIKKSSLIVLNTFLAQENIFSVLLFHSNVLIVSPLNLLSHFKLVFVGFFSSKVSLIPQL